jgi:hypothetical protein
MECPICGASLDISEAIREGFSALRIGIQLPPR